MLWVTRHHIRVNRTATAWLVHFADFPAECRLPIDLPARQSLGTLDMLSPGGPRNDRRLPNAVAEAMGLRAISRGFPLVAADDDETVVRSGFLYDALYAALQERRGT